MFPKKLKIFGVFLSITGFVLLLHGCGLRESNTGSLFGRIIDFKGNVVENAEVYSLFNEIEKVSSDKEGKFFLPNLPAGRNRIIVSHPYYLLSETVVEIPNHDTLTIEKITLEAASESQLISDTHVQSVTSSTATLAWKTYSRVRCRIEYGEGRGYGKSLEETEAKNDHVFTIPDLKPETVYHSRVGFFDSTAAFRYSVDIPFKTLSPDFPAPPTNVRVTTTNSYGVFNIEWDLSSTSTVIGYRVNRREKGGEWLTLKSENLDKKTKSFADKTAEGGIFYEYSVSAVDQGGGVSTSDISPRVFMPGIISRTVIITASDSPIDLFADLIVSPNVSLYIEKGVEFRVAASDAFRIGKDPDRVEVLVQGYAQITGTASETVKFTPMNGVGARNHWAGFRFENGQSGNSQLSYVEMAGCKDYGISVDKVETTFKNVNIRFSGGGIFVSGVKTFPAIENCYIEDVSSVAVLVENTRWFRLASSTVKNSGIGLLLISDAQQSRVEIEESWLEGRNDGISGTFKNSIIQNSIVISEDGTGIRYRNAMGEKNILDHCTIDALYGVLIELGAVTLENNLIINLQEKGKTGIRYLPGDMPSFEYNDVHGFTTAYQGCAAGAGAKSVKPEFLNRLPFDYRMKDITELKTADRYHGEMGRYGKSYY